MDQSKATATEELEAQLPTPLTEHRLVDGSTIWCKRDGLSGASYGGNKLRKLAALLTKAKQQRRNHIVTVGAAGSHHVLATSLFGQREGMGVSAVLLPQQDSPHVRQVLAATARSGCAVLPAKGPRDATRIVRSLVRKFGRDNIFWLGPGGLGPTGSLPYADAVAELELQLKLHQLPAPQRLLVPVGSGSTAVGLAVGLAESSLRAVVHGVAVGNTPALRHILDAQLALLARRRSPKRWRALFREARERLVLDERWAGRGYGKSTATAELAMAEESSIGLPLEITYTAKALGAAKSMPRSAGETIFWHTLSERDPNLPDSTSPPAGPTPLRHLLMASP